MTVSAYDVVLSTGVMCSGLGGGAVAVLLPQLLGWVRYGQMLFPSNTSKIVFLGGVCCFRSLLARFEGLAFAHPCAPGISAVPR